MVSYFVRTPLDAEFYDRYIRARLPERILDAHLHVSKEFFGRNVKNDPLSWTSLCKSYMDVEDYKGYAAAFYPDVEVEINALPEVNKGIDVEGGNEYLAELKRTGQIRFAHMLTDPAWDGAHTEKILLDGNFDGYKPYPDFVSGARGADIGLFAFMNHEQLAVLNKHHKSMVLHLPRKGRFPDDDNIRELKTMRELYPDIKIIIAHCGRSYAINTIREAYRKLGSLMNEFYYDLAAVLNPAVLRFMLAHVPHDRIIYGTDLPVFLWHGRRRWTDDEYFNLSREEFGWEDQEAPETREGYTFFLYEQLKNILDAADEYDGKPLAEKLFYSNAVKIIGG